MSVDVVDEMTRLWSELRKGVNLLDEQSPEAKLEKFLERVATLRGVELQTIYPGLEELDDEADSVLKKATRRSDKIQAAMEKLSLPPSESAWRAFADALGHHLDQNPKDIGARLEALSREDRIDLGERARVMREALS